MRRPLFLGKAERAEPAAGDSGRVRVAEADGSFLARWARRKEIARRTEAAPDALPAPSDALPGTSEAPDQNTAPAASEEGGTGAGESPADLPALEEITAETDITGFLTRGVADAVRNAALRRMWSLDPAIRDYVGDARDYGYDWNVVGGVPGFGAIDPAYDVQGMLAGLFSRGEPEPAAETTPDVPSLDAMAEAPATPGEPAIEGAAPAERASRASPAGAERVPEERGEPDPAASTSEPDAPSARVEVARRHGRATPV